jgi:hypothetical protein
VACFAVWASGDVDTETFQDKLARGHGLKKLDDSFYCERQIDALHVLFFRAVCKDAMVPNPLKTLGNGVEHESA